MFGHATALLLSTSTCFWVSRDHDMLKSLLEDFPMKSSGGVFLPGHALQIEEGGCVLLKQIIAQLT